MSMTKGTPLSSQIIWLEERVKELEAQNALFGSNNVRLTVQNEQFRKEINRLYKLPTTTISMDVGLRQKVEELSAEKHKLEEENEKLISEIKKLSESNDEFKKEFAKAKTTYAVNVYRYENEKLKKEINCLRRSREGLQDQVNELVQENNNKAFEIAQLKGKPKKDTRWHPWNVSIVDVPPHGNVIVMLDNGETHSTHSDLVSWQKVCHHNDIVAWKWA